MNEPTGIEKLVAEDIANRQKLGLEKYGVSLKNNPLTELEVLQHAYEEALDFSMYLKKLIVEKQNYSYEALEDAMVDKIVDAIRKG